jgi:rubrerythrin
MKSTNGHLNRTGVTLSPELARALIEAARATPPSSDGDAEAIAAVRIEYSKAGQPTGSMPPELGAVRARNGAQRGIPVFLDKLGERLAFERSGVRLYDALLSKFDAFGTWKGGPSRGDLEEIRSEELEHFTMLAKTMAQVGGDPTAVTPSANLQAVASKGLPAVLVDPRTNLRESLEAVLVAELVDNDCWENLSDLALAMGEEELANAFRHALDHERDHLRRVRGWLGIALSQAVGGRAEGVFLRRIEQREDGATPSNTEMPRRRAGPPSPAGPSVAQTRGAKSKRRRKAGARSARPR